MSVWFDGSGDVDCTVMDVKQAFEDYGEHLVGVVSRMPGLTSVEIVDQGSNWVTIKTNEGLMRRTNLSKRIEGDTVVVESDEEYQAGSRVTVTSHLLNEFASSDTGVTHRLVMSDVNAPGFLGALYRRFGGSKMGKAYLVAYTAYLEDSSE